MKIPRPTRVQGLRGIRVAVALNEEGTLDQPVVIDQRSANRTSARVAAASNAEVIRDPPKGQATLPARDRQEPAAPFAALTDKNDTTVTSSQARQAAIDDDAILSAIHGSRYK